jgi:hypothetical protein
VGHVGFPAADAGGREVLAEIDSERDAFSEGPDDIDEDLGRREGGHCFGLSGMVRMAGMGGDQLE